jgi:hypothetical protein
MSAPWIKQQKEFKRQLVHKARYCSDIQKEFLCFSVFFQFQLAGCIVELATDFRASDCFFFSSSLKDLSYSMYFAA